MTDIFIAGLLAEPIRQSRSSKGDAAPAAPQRQRRLGARKAVGRRTQRRA
jgi:hypothetical protein